MTGENFIYPMFQHFWVFFCAQKVILAGFAVWAPTLFNDTFLGFLILLSSMIEKTLKNKWKELADFGSLVFLPHFCTHLVHLPSDSRNDPVKIGDFRFFLVIFWILPHFGKNDEFLWGVLKYDG